MQDNQFTINGFFNNLPIRIIGSPEEPFFYASDVGAVLGIKNISVSIKNFDETEIVTPDVRAQYQLATYRKYKDELRRDDSVILLTEHGVHRLVMNSRNDIAKEFKKYIYQLIKNTRLAERQKLKVIPQNDLEELKTRMELVERQYIESQKHNPTVYVFTKEINDIPYNHMVKSDVDSYFADYETDFCKTLYKFTTKTTSDDYNRYKLYAKIYGDSEQIMDDLTHDSLAISQPASKYSRYHADFDFANLNGKIAYE
jgi:prophage antirepressor-like protein